MYLRKGVMKMLEVRGYPLFFDNFILNHIPNQPDLALGVQNRQSLLEVRIVEQVSRGAGDYENCPLKIDHALSRMRGSFI